MSDKPLVSVIIPVYNGADMLPAALESVFEQDYAPLEVVVVDDGSTDGSTEVAESYDGVRVIRQPNAGPSAARNTGLANTTGPLIAFLDADDVWPPGRLTRLVDVLNAHPSCGAALGQFDTVSETDLQPLMPAQFGFIFGTALLRRSTFETVGPLDPSLRYSEDMDWFMRVREAGIDIIQVPEVLYLYRQHDASLTAQPDADDFGMALAIKRSLDRRRAQGSTDLPDPPTVS
ncbi:MAG: glycosyltransferase family A protein [Bacteroidota bacterium]